MPGDVNFVIEIHNTSHQSPATCHPQPRRRVEAGAQKQDGKTCPRPSEPFLRTRHDGEGAKVTGPPRVCFCGRFLFSHGFAPRLSRSSDFFSFWSAPTLIGKCQIQQLKRAHKCLFGIFGISFYAPRNSAADFAPDVAHLFRQAQLMPTPFGQTLMLYRHINR